MPNVILFDVDGVLVNGEAWIPNLTRHHEITGAMLRPFFQGPFQVCLIGQADVKEVLAPYLAQWRWQQSADAFLEYWFRQQHVINEQLVQAIQQLRANGLKCYLATQQERYRTAYILNEMGFSTLFDGMFSSADLGYMKNDFRFFESILYKLQEQAENVLFWDDSPNNVATAKSVGIQAEVYSDFADFTHKMREWKLMDLAGYE